MDDFYLTTWPAAPIPEREVDLAWEVLSVDGDLLFASYEGDRVSPGLLPGEVYIRDLFKLDVKSPEALVEFVTKYGLPVDPRAPWRDLADPNPAPYPTFTQPLGDGSLLDTTLRRIRETVEAALPADQSWLDRAVFHLDELRLRYRRLRDMVRVWDYLQGGLTEEEFRKEWESRVEEAPQDARDAGRWLAECLTAALWPYQPVVAFENWPPVRPVTSYSGMCLQLFNHVVEGAGYRRCNECRTRFVRHQGEAVTRSARREGDVYFCSKRCTDKYASREYRRRQRAQALRNQGLSIPEIAEKMNATSVEVKAWLKGVSKEE